MSKGNITIIIFALFLTLVFGSTAFATEAYHNPGDGKTYVTDKWVTYTPEPSQNSNSKQDAGIIVSIESVTLLSPQNDFEEIGVKSLAKYVETLKDILKEQAQKFNCKGRVIVQIELAGADDPKISMVYDGKISQDLLQGFYGTAVKVSLRSKTKTLKLQVLFDVAHQDPDQPTISHSEHNKSKP